ncbi:uracil phosphoribosyltransferase [Bacteroidetes bacterium endosymbiont of Geopemphigus sp.]|uniref:uracil phosphoribosyltransferase n=1 Tax=Bacteroidetes bacterium endosymbiont of Geopemphigus sp. TaxID=2047937 RepID=UPI00321B52FB
MVVDYPRYIFFRRKIVIILDPMPAAGESLINVYKTLQKYGTLHSLHLVLVVAAHPDIDYIRKHLPEKTKLWVASIDEELNDKSYIVPGLGDAGDLAFGK